MELSDEVPLIENPEEGTYFKTRVSKWHEWCLKHGALRKPQFIVYALTWIKVIWQNAMKSTLNEEDEEEPTPRRELHDVHCTRKAHLEGEVLEFEWDQETPNGLVKGDRFVLSRTSMEIDGYLKHVMTVDATSSLKLTVFAPARVPFDIESGVWRLTQLPQCKDEAFRLCTNVRRLLEYPVSNVLTDLICDDTLPSETRSQMNQLQDNTWNRLHGHLDRLRDKHRLNPSQLGAVAASIRQVITLIQGPPGTGKTATAVAIVELNALITTLLGVCAPSNTAVDELLLRLLTQPMPQQFLRMGKLKRISQVLKDNYLEICYEARLNEHMGEQNRFNKTGKRLRHELEEELLHSGILFGTLSVLVSKDCMQYDQWDAILIDEAGQASEPSTVGPCGAAQRVILIGDHNQLPPNSEHAQMSISLLEKLVKEAAMPLNMLNVQYRMPPQIARWPAHFFYQEKLQSFKGEPTRQQLPPGFPWPHDSPLAFVNVTSKELSMNPGFRNMGEVKVICDIVERMTSKGVSPSSFGVISPYSAQTSILGRRLSEKITVGNVDSFQGKEKEIIIVSFVRSNNAGAAGFMTDGRRLNVSVTRATGAMILVGNAGFLMGATDEFEDLITHCHKMDCIIGEPVQVPDWTASKCTSTKKTKTDEYSMSSSMTQILIESFACLSASDKRTILDQCFQAMEQVLDNQLFGPIFDYALSRPYWVYKRAERPSNIWDWDIKSWSRFGEITGLAVDKDPGNMAYMCGLVVLLRAFRDVPMSWLRKLHRFLDISSETVSNWSSSILMENQEFAGDVLEAVAGLVTWKSPQPREFCQQQHISERAADLLLSALSQWMSKVFRLCQYYTGCNDKSELIAYWIEESGRHWRRFDFEIETTDDDMDSTDPESDPPAGSTRDLTTVAERGRVAIEPRPPRIPPKFPKGDRRFRYDKETRRYRCDKCSKLVKYNDQATAFLGAYVNKTWECEVTQLKRLWKRGEIDATFYCLRCLAEYHNVGEDKAKEFVYDEIEYRQKRTQEWENSKQTTKRKKKRRRT